jgi:outer membrane beta-barrel protein
MHRCGDSRAYKIKYIIFIASYLMGGICSASDSPISDETPKVIAVQNRSYFLGDEFTVQAGYLPLDSFTKYLAFGATYAHFFSDFLGWEVVNGQYAQALDTGLRSDLTTNFGATALKGDVLQYYATTNLIYTPLYNKNLLFNKSVVEGETSLVGGVGFSKFDSGNANTFDLGIIFRFLLSKNSALKLDIRNYLYISTLDTKNNLMLILGYSYTFGSRSEVAGPNIQKENKDKDEDE